MKRLVSKLEKMELSLTDLETRFSLTFSHVSVKEVRWNGDGKDDLGQEYESNKG